MSEPIVRVCGLGVHPPGEITLETIQALSECRVVFCDVADKKVFAWLEGYCSKVKRPKNAAEIVSEAKKGGLVGLAVWGHPSFSSLLAREAQVALRKAGLTYRVYGAISPIGSAFARSVSFLGGDYGYQGIQGYELQTLLDDPSALSLKLPLVVYAEDAPAARWEGLTKLLREKYPKEHGLSVYPAGTSAGRGETVGSLKASALAGAVLLVPPAA
jgi:hypothetical protein